MARAPAAAGLGGDASARPGLARPRAGDPGPRRPGPPRRDVRRAGFSVWDNTWYDGHHALGYSLVFPAVGAAVGARIAGAAAAVASAALFESLLRGRRARAACWWFGIGCVADLVIGRLTYALGVAVGLAAIAAFTRGWTALAAALAVACAATSPVSGLFLALAGVGLALARRRAEALALSGAAGVTVVALSVAFPEGGAQPFSVASFATAVGVSLGVAVAVRRDRGLRLAPLLYVAAVGVVRDREPDGRERDPPRHGVRRAARARRRGPVVAVARDDRGRGVLAPRRRCGSGSTRPCRPPARGAIRPPRPSTTGRCSRSCAAPTRAARDRGPVHARPLGVRVPRPPLPARPRLGAPARPAPEPAVLCPSARRGRLRALAALRGGAVCRAA